MSPFEGALGLAAIAWVAAAPPIARRGNVALLRLLGAIGRHRAACITALALLAGVMPALGARFVRWPEPAIHDEFAYLLIGDTFAEGRVAMPTHPLWPHFDTFHVLQRPTYAAKYPPALGLPYALGIAWLDEPAVGLWLQSAAMCAAVAWMLFGWLPARWAVGGAVLCLLRFCTSGPWVQTFFGGAVAATGGALVLGAAARLLRSPRARDGLALGVGLALLANSRPFEGLVLALVAGAWTGIALARRGDGSLARAARRALLPATLVLGATGAGMAYYNARVTGSATTLPYAVHDAQYMVYPPFLWQPVRSENEARHDILGAFATGFQRGAYGAFDDAEAFARLVWERARVLGRAYFGGLLWLPFAFSLWALFVLRRARSRGLRPSLGVLAAVFAALCTTTYLEPRYAAPATAAALLAVAAGWREMVRAPFLGRRRSDALSLALAAAAVAISAASFAVRRVPETAWFGQIRAGVRDRLLATPGDDLVLVEYTDGHLVHNEWVYNAADIDASPIVWARDLGEAANRALLAHYEGRVVWRLVSGDLPRDGFRLTRLATEDRATDSDGRSGGSGGR